MDMETNLTRGYLVSSSPNSSKEVSVTSAGFSMNYIEYI